MIVRRSQACIRLVCALVTFAVFSGPGMARAPEVWLGGVDPNARRKMFHENVSDYMDLFDESAAWVQAASHVQVFQINAGFVFYTPDDQLKNLFMDLKRRRIALAMEALILSGSHGCGAGMEGFSAPSSMKDVADRIIRLGGDLRYVAMDEPAWFGHHANGPTACHASLAEIAEDAARKVFDLRRAFPSVQIGDVEPVGTLDPPDWLDEVMRWTEAYHAAVGEPLNFLHADVQWGGAWRDQLPLFARSLRRSGIKFGIIYNGAPADGTGEEWTRHAEERFSGVEDGLRAVPDQAIFQSWHRQPERFLPETQPGTMTNLIDRYWFGR